MKSPRNHRRPRAWALILLCLPALLYGAKGAFESNSNNVIDWLPRSFEETQRLFWFVERFGSDEILVVSWPDCTFDDPRLEQFARKLTRPIATSPDGQPEVLFRRVITGPRVIREMTAPPLSFSEPEALRRMRGWLVGPDGKTTCAVALVSWAGIHDRHAALQSVYSAAAACGLARDELFVGGSTRDSVAIDQASEQWLLELILLSILCGLFVAWVCLRRAGLIASVVLTAIVAWSASLSCVYYSGWNMDATLLMMPGLVFVLAVSGAVHLANYYSEAVHQGHGTDAPAQAIRWGRLPCFLACGTTAIGLGSLAVSQITPIRKFGIFSAIGVLLVFAALIVVWPVAMQLWTSSKAPRTNESRSPRRTGQRAATAWWEPIFRLAVRFHMPIVLATAVIVPLLALGVYRVRTSAKLEDLFHPQSDLIRSYAWLQEAIGPLVPVEVVLRFDSHDPADPAQLVRRVAFVERLRQKIERMEDLGGTIAASTFAPAIPNGGGVRQVARRAAIARRLGDRRQQFTETRYLRETGNEQLWRISARAEALKNVDYGEILRRLEREVDAFLSEERSRSGPDASARICGAVPLVYMAQQQLLRDLTKSFLTAFALIALTMTVLMRSVRAGLLSMVPNVFPAALVFGAMGWLGKAVDIGAMMTASAAMGIAVDDTVHFLVWFRRGASQGLSNRDAVRFAFERCATPMAQTTVICGLGLLAFALSPFAPVARFAWLMAILLVAALVGDLVLLPALLSGYLGKLFVPKLSTRPERTGLDDESGSFV